MVNTQSHIPFIKSITDFFEVYGVGKPLHPDIMCMRLEDQPDTRLLYMPLYRANFYRVIHFIDSEIQSFTNSKQQKIPQNCLVFSFPSKLESWERKGKLYGNVIYFSADFLGLDVTNRIYEQNFPFFTNNVESILQVSPDESNLLKTLSDEMIEEIYSEKSDKLELIKLLLTTYLHKIKRIYLEKTENYSLETKNNKSLFYRFRLEIDNYFLLLASQQKSKMPSVAHLAQILNLNPNNLNTVIKNQTGKTASSYIQDKMLLEAKSYLLYTNLQIAEIAYRLGFENLPYFNRFFKKHSLLTPLEYRNQAKNGAIL